MDQALKILIAGDWHSELHEEAVFNAFLQLGHEPTKFSWHQYFKPRGSGVLPNWFTGLCSKAQNKYMFGPRVAELNKDLFELAMAVQPEVVFIYRGSHVHVDTVKKIKSALRHTLIIGYNNDDPFAPQYPWWQWRHFLACVPAYDLTLAYREHNLDEYRAIGAKRVQLLRSWFIPERNYPRQLTPSEREKYACDVVFVGHYENDGRLEYLEEIARQGWHLRIFGPGYEWDPILRKSAVLSKCAPVTLVWGEEYNQALCGAKLALCFFSKLNRDTYTRRCFEIPASGAVLVSEFSDDMAALYKDRQELVLFKSVDELIQQAEVLLRNDAQREQLAAAGTKRVWADRHDVVSRMQDLINSLATLKET